ncbi:hypothetical protein ACHAQH_009027 [Verticillium albo-atrum]
MGIEDQEADNDEWENESDISDVEQWTYIKWDSFINWLRSDSPVYWISGKPGSGKTTLMNYMVSNPRTATALRVWSPNFLIVSHFF